MIFALSRYMYVSLAGMFHFIVHFFPRQDALTLTPRGMSWSDVRPHTT